MNLTALRTELQTDPNGHGYEPFVAGGADAEVASLLNRVRGTITVFRNDITGAELVGAVVLVEYAALLAAQREFLNTLILAGRVDVTNATTRANLASVFAAGATSRVNLVALASRAGSRAEQLFGTGVAVSSDDVAKALRG